MTTPTHKDLSPFAEAAMSLDSSFAELNQLSGQLERLSLESDSGLDRAKKILAEFGECGEQIGTRLQNLAKTLEEARNGAEKAAQLIGARAGEVQARQLENDQMMERFGALSEMVRRVSELLKQLKKPQDEKLSAEEQSFLMEKLPELDLQMNTLSEEASKLRVDAQKAKFKTIERNADSLSQTLTSARRKLGAFVPRRGSDSSLLQ